MEQTKNELEIQNMSWLQKLRNIIKQMQGIELKASSYSHQPQKKSHNLMHGYVYRSTKSPIGDRIMCGFSIIHFAHFN